MNSNLQFINIDVSALAPPEPMTVILTHLATLTQSQCLVIKHRRQPFPLYVKLKEAGFSYHCIEHGLDHISLYIFHHCDQQAFEQTLVNLVSSEGLNK